MLMSTRQIGQPLPTNTCLTKSLMAARHYREARFALRYQTHLTVVCLVGISRGAGVSACLVVVRLVAVRI